MSTELLNFVESVDSQNIFKSVKDSMLTWVH